MAWLVKGNSTTGLRLSARVFRLLLDIPATHRNAAETVAPTAFVVAQIANCFTKRWRIAD